MTTRWCSRWKPKSSPSRRGRRRLKLAVEPDVLVGDRLDPAERPQDAGVLLGPAPFRVVVLDHSDGGVDRVFEDVLAELVEAAEVVQTFELFGVAERDVVGDVVAHEALEHRVL